MPTELIKDAGEVSVSVCLSAPILESDVKAAAPSSALAVEMGVAEPDVMWLRSPEQLNALGPVMRRTLAKLRDRIPRLSRLHLFYAGRAGPDRGPLLIKNNAL